AEVVRVAARKARLGREAQNEWAAFRLDAVRKAGRTLASMREAGLLASGRGGDRRSINATLIERQRSLLGRIRAYTLRATG
ncbi:MAG: hypothetical protein ACREMY_10520, partial [bacterium]